MARNGGKSQPANRSPSKIDKHGGYPRQVFPCSTKNCISSYHIPWLKTIV
jgi:hypothetical protein